MKILVLLVVSLAVEVNGFKRVFDRGSNATLECSAEEVVKCELTYSNRVNLVSRKNPKQGQFEIRDNKTCIINIHNVQFGNADSYVCYTENDYIEYQVSVCVEPNEPQMLYNGHEIKNNSTNAMYLSADGWVKIECHSIGGYPNATITWFVDDKLQSNSETEVEVKDELLNKRSFISLRYEDPEAPSLRKVRCVVDHLAYTATTRRILTGFFAAAYPTNQVTITIVPPKPPARLADFEVICKANGLPTPIDFRIMRETDVKGKYDVVAKTKNQYESSQGYRCDRVDSGVFRCETRDAGVFQCEARYQNGESGQWGDYLASNKITFSYPDSLDSQDGTTWIVVWTTLGVIIVVVVTVVIAVIVWRIKKLSQSSSRTVKRLDGQAAGQ